MDEDYRQGLVHLFYEEAEPVVGSAYAITLIARASGRSLESIAGWFGVSRERVRQIQNKAIGNIPDPALELLVALADLTPEPISVVKKSRRANRARLRRFIEKCPALAYNYRKLHLQCGIEPLTEGDFYGHRALERLCIDYHVTRVGDEYRCVYCHQFKHKSEYAPAVSKNKDRTLICRKCNDARCRQWRASHVEEVRAYARKRNTLPVQKVYRERWMKKKLAADPEYFNRSRREVYRRKLDAMTPEQKEAWNDKSRERSREYYARRKLGLVKS